MYRAGVRSILLAFALVFCLHGAGATGSEWTLRVPLGLQEHAAFIPEDNPPTPEKIALGKQLFWDKRWSRNGTVACVSCHDPGHGWADPRPFSVTFEGKPTSRHSPTLVNRLFSDRQQWTGARASLEDQAMKARDQSPELQVKNLGAIAGYREQFLKVFDTPVTPEGVAKTIAAYERTILSGNSPYDRFVAGDRAALSPATQLGLALFEGKAGCKSCHTGFNFTDEGYHNLGVGMDRPVPDLGRFTVSNKQADRGAFKTPTLRDVARRPPYMHDASARTLDDVIALYDRGGIPNPWLSSAVRPLGLTAEERAALVAFLEALTGEVSPDVTSPPRLPE